MAKRDLILIVYKRISVYCQVGDNLLIGPTASLKHDINFDKLFLEYKLKEHTIACDRQSKKVIEKYFFSLGMLNY